MIGTQTPLHELLEGLIADKELPAKDKRKRLKQVWKYPFEKKTCDKRNILKCRLVWRNIFEVLMLHCSCAFHSCTSEPLMHMNAQSLVFKYNYCTILMQIFPISVPEVIPRGLPESISHWRKQSCCHTRENHATQTSSYVLQPQEILRALSEELEFQSLIHHLWHIFTSGCIHKSTSVSWNKEQCGLNGALATANKLYFVALLN